MKMNEPLSSLSMTLLRRSWLCGQRRRARTVPRKQFNIDSLRGYQQRIHKASRATLNCTAPAVTTPLRLAKDWKGQVRAEETSPLNRAGLKHNLALELYSL